MDELCESAYRTVIGIHLAKGNVIEALRTFDLCRSVLVQELGIGPSDLSLVTAVRFLGPRFADLQ